MCGIWGFSGKEGKRASIRKLMALGLYNVQRGTDNCGYYWSGNLVKGVAEESNFSIFIADNKLERGNLKPEVFMGHTRKSTSGSNAWASAHPHEVNNRYVQTHNGVIKNIWALCLKHGVNHTQIHVDSIGLAHIIEKDGFDVLHEYEGYASLTMTFKDDPGALYLYHGKSKEFKTGEAIEERPLFLLETAEGIYYSSMKASLDFINESTKVKPFVLNHNCVFKLVNGEITKFRYHVNREENNVGKTTVYYGHGGGSCAANAFTNRGREIPFSGTTRPAASTTMPKPVLTALPPANSNGSHDSLILRETYPPEFYTEQDIHYKAGRHFRNDNVLLNGVYKIDRKGFIIENGKKSTELVEDFYFIRGVRVRTKKIYEQLISDMVYLNQQVNFNFAFFMSEFSCYPVVNLADECNSAVNVEEIKRFFYKDKKKYTGVFDVKFSIRKYDVKEGLIHKISKTYDGEEVFHNKDTKLATFEIDRIEPEDDKEVSIQIIIEQVLDWSQRVIDKGIIKTIPEVFLMFIDYYNLRYYNGKEVAEGIVEEETVATLRDLIHSHNSFQSYLVGLFDKGFINEENIRKCFADYSVDEVIAFDNRFKYVPFDDMETAVIAQVAKKSKVDKTDILEIIEEENAIIDAQVAKEQSTDPKNPPVIILPKGTRFSDLTKAVDETKKEIDQILNNEPFKRQSSII